MENTELISWALSGEREEIAAYPWLSEVLNDMDDENGIRERCEEEGIDIERARFFYDDINHEYFIPPKTNVVYGNIGNDKRFFFILRFKVETNNHHPSSNYINVFYPILEDYGKTYISGNMYMYNCPNTCRE